MNNKKLIIYSALGLIGLTAGGVYTFKKPKLVIGKVNPIDQSIEFTFDGKSYTYISGTDQALSIASRSFKLDVRDVVSKIGNLVNLGFVKFTIIHFGKEVVLEETYDPLKHGYIAWRWNKNSSLIIGQ
jgi:hypothetical protein